MKYFALDSLDFDSHLTDRASLTKERSDAIWEGEDPGVSEFVIQEKRSSLGRVALLWHVCALPFLHRDLCHELEQLGEFPHRFFPIRIVRGAKVLSAAYNALQVPPSKAIDLDASDATIDRTPGFEPTIQRARKIAIDAAVAEGYPVVLDRRIGRKKFLVSEELRAAVRKNFRGPEIRKIRYLDCDNAEELSYL